MYITIKRSILGLAAILFFAAGFVSSCKDDDRNNELIAVKGVTISRSTLDLHLGDGIVDSTFVLTYNLNPPAATNIASVTWSSSNVGIATVSRSGLVSSVSLGTASITVTVTVTDGKTFTDKCDVTVIPPPVGVTGVAFAKEGQELEPGQSIKLTPIVEPADASNKSFLWESSNYDVASVDDEGVVTGGDSISTAFITVTTVDGQFKARYTITVVQVAVTDLTLSGSGKITLAVDEEVPLTATVTPATANQTVSWQSSDPAVVTVDATGKLRGRSIGAATVTVRTENSGHQVTREVEVVPTALKGVTIVQNAPVHVFEGITQEYTLSVTYNPANATNKNVTWSSSNTAVAEIAQNGRITPKSAGTTTISITAADGGYTHSLAVKVEYFSYISRAKWSIVGYDDSYNDVNTAGPGWSSQATNEGGVASPQGRITAILDDDVTLFWHSSYSAPAENYPHWFIVDLGEEVTFDAAMLQRRQGNGGTANGYYIRTSTKANPDINDPVGGYDWVERGEYSFNPAINDRQAKAFGDTPVTARYVLMYFDVKHRGSGNNAMFASFGLYKRN